jgi:hypothetical protein
MRSKQKSCALTKIRLSFVLKLFLGTVVADTQSLANIKHTKHHVVTLETPTQNATSIQS